MRFCCWISRAESVVKSERAQKKKPRPACAGGVEILESDSSPLRRVAAYTDYAYYNGRYRNECGKSV